MTDKRTTPEAGVGRRKRAVPTIDLTATEVPAEAAASEPPPTSEADPPPPEQPVQEQPTPEKPAPDTEPVAVAEDETPASPASSLFSAPTIAAGAAGAAVMTLVLFGLWLTGLLPIRYAGSTATRARVAALEMELHDLQSRSAAAVDTKAVDALTQRVAAADNAMKSLGLTLTALKPPQRRHRRCRRASQ